MIPFDQIDKRLDALGKDRKWLAEVTGRSYDSLRTALAPKAPESKRSDLLQKALTDAIEREEEARAAMLEPPVIGFHNMFLDDVQMDRADRASRKINAASLVEFCRDAILFRADELLSGRQDPVPKAHEGNSNTAPFDYRTIPMNPPSILQEACELPFYGLVAAGNPGGPADIADGTVQTTDHYDPATHYVLRVNGRSMEPEYQDGSMVVVRKLKDGEYLKNGQDVVACDAAGAYLKRLAYVKDGPKGQGPRKAAPRLVSLNPDYPEVVPVADSPIVAVVVGKA